MHRVKNKRERLEREKPMKDADMRVLLAEVYETGQQHDAQQQERSKKMLNLEPEDILTT